MRNKENEKQTNKEGEGENKIVNEEEKLEDTANEDIKTEQEIIKQVEKIMETTPKQTRKRKRRKKRWGIRRKVTIGDQTQDDTEQPREEEDTPINMPMDLKKLIGKDPGLTYKAEQSGRQVNY